MRECADVTMILPEMIDMSCLLLPTAAAAAAPAAAHVTADSYNQLTQLFNYAVMPAAAAGPQLFYGKSRCLIWSLSS